MLVIDDLDLFYDGNSSLSVKSKEIKNLFSNGRHQRVGCIWISKALKYIPKKVISNTDVFYIGNFIEISADLFSILGDSGSFLADSLDNSADFLAEFS